MQNKLFLFSCLFVLLLSIALNIFLFSENTDLKNNYVLLEKKTKKYYKESLQKDLVVDKKDKIIESKNKEVVQHKKELKKEKQEEKELQKKYKKAKNKLEELAFTSSSDPCQYYLQSAASQGLTLPDSYQYLCPGGGLDYEGNSHWGVTCPYSMCPEGEGPYISVSNPTEYVIYHELCHARFEYSAAEEIEADQCAARYGASLAESPYL